MVEQTVKRNGAIDFMKFVFALIIVLFHGSEALYVHDSERFFLSGRLGVEFFFIVSGFFMAVSIEKLESKNTSTMTGGGYKQNAF